MPWKKDYRVRDLLSKIGALPESKPCHDCGAQPGEIHKDGCDTERCSVCGGQYFVCGCAGHDKGFARWTGFWPGSLEALALGYLCYWEPDPRRPVPADNLMAMESMVDMNTVAEYGLDKLFFIKPVVQARKTKVTPKPSRRSNAKTIRTQSR
jgi:hypothetical protein